MAMFEIMTPENSAEITLNDNGGTGTARDFTGGKLWAGPVAPPARWIIGRGAKAVFYAVYSYAKMNNIPIERVGYSVRYTDEGLKVEDEGTGETAHRKKLYADRQHEHWKREAA